jgi:RecB family exonuclease
VITSRRLTLHRAADLAAFRATLTGWIAALTPDSAPHACVMVPTTAAAEQLRRTVADRLPATEVVWPVVATRRSWYDELTSRLPIPPRVLSAADREVLLASAARSCARQGLTLPYDLRPGLVAEMLSLYDHIRRLGRSIDDFERNLAAELEREQDTDRGAERLLEQTRFLAVAYRAYEKRLADDARVDEHGLRELLMRTPAARPLRRVMVTTADRLTDSSGGMWPADFDVLARLPDLEQIDLLYTERMLAAGQLERLYAAFPDLLEEFAAPSSPHAPILVVPRLPPTSEEQLWFGYRDREEELVGVARRLKEDRRQGVSSPIHRSALIVRRPLPYLYLARGVFADAGIPCEALDTLPLAAEPYAAAVDLVLDAVASDFTRASLLALLRSPHFALGAPPDALGACDATLAESRYLGGLDRLEALVERWSSVQSPSGAAQGSPGRGREAPASREERRRDAALPTLRAALEAVKVLRPLAESRPMVSQIATLVDWLHRFEPAAGDHPTEGRRRRVRSAVVATLAALGRAYETYDPEATGDVTALAAALRRWLGGQTFATQTGEPGLQIVEADAARYGDFDDVQIVGLVNGEWPEPTRRNVLYPASLLALLEPAAALPKVNDRERQSLQMERAAFRDLVTSPRRRVRLSTFLLENDAVVERSILLDEVGGFGLEVARVELASPRVTAAEAMAVEPGRTDGLPAATRAWADLRHTRDRSARERWAGEAGPWQMARVSVSRLEQFLMCPFKFFAAHVLRLEELPEDQAIQTPLERGRFLHELWERFFAEWQRRGHGRISADRLHEARALFDELCEAALAELSPAEAALERVRLLGSAASPGIAHRVFTMEAERPVRVLERLLEFPIAGQFQFRAKDGNTRTVTLNAKTDRIDVLEGGGLRVIDYKSKNTPDPKVALQLPVYAHLARESLSASRGGQWRLDEAMYVSFEGDRAIVKLRPAKGQSLDDVVADAEDRLVDALDRIAQGHFPPMPAKKSFCGPCSFRTVCRLEYSEQTQTANSPLEGTEEDPERTPR